MRNILLLATVVLCFLFAYESNGQNGIQYQGVAVNDEGVILTEQDINLKFSIVETNNTSEVAWEETHSTTTSDCGLFEVSIGQGERIDGLATFDLIEWSLVEYSIEVFADFANSGTYQLLGVNAINAVPYALESKVGLESLNEKQSLEFDNDTGLITLTGNEDSQEIYPLNTIELSNNGNVVNLISNEGAIISSVDMSQRTFNRRGADFDFPEGQDGEYMFLAEEEYTVPVGKNLYLINADAEIEVELNAQFVEHFTTPNMPLLTEGAVIRKCNCSALLVDKTEYLETVFIDFSSVQAYLVPEGKVFYLKSGLDNDDSVVIQIDGNNYKFMKPNETRGTLIITIPAGHIFSLVDGQEENTVSGYLVSPNN